MIMLQIVKVAFILSLFILVSCSSVKETSKNKDSEQTLKLNIDNSFVKNLELEGDFHIKANFGEYNFAGEIKIDSSYKISIDLFGPFGIQLAKIYSDTNKFIAHNIFENTIYTGSPTEENIYKATGIYLSVKDLIKIIKSELMFPSSEYIKDNLYEQGNLFKRVDKRKFADYALINEQQLLQEYQRKDQNNATMFRILIDDYLIDSNYKIAKSINIVISNKDFNFKFLATSIKVNKDASLPNKFNIPTSAKIINLNEID